MRKKIAVCGNGWNNEFLKIVLTGIRKKALEDAMELIGLSLTPDNIICGDWNYVETIKRLPIWLDNQKEFPKAFICANDVMDMATCSVLKDRNIRVPEDCIVTGFDHLGWGGRVFDGKPRF